MTVDAPLLASVANLGLEGKGIIDDFKTDTYRILARVLVAKWNSEYGYTNEYILPHTSEAEAGASSTVLGKVSKGAEMRCYQ